MITRRRFLKRTGLSVAAFASPSVFAGSPSSTQTIYIIASPGDSVASSVPARWAMAELQAALQSRGMSSQLAPALNDTPAGAHCIVVSDNKSQVVRDLLPRSADLSSPESLGLVSANVGGRKVLLACGNDSRGLVYALLEVSERVRFAENVLAAFEQKTALVERPANSVRSIGRCFVSEPEDKPWFYDRAMWGEYLTMLATQRFNRFSFTVGIGYDTASRVTDSYFLFAYPFLLAVPGYDVVARGLPDSERDRNLQMLRFISDETERRGMDFQLGLWTHSYDWPHSPNVNYPIVGLTPESHAVYCRDALAAVLKACPAVRGVTLRVHSESGVPAGSEGFWKTVFEGAKLSGRRVELDLHSKELPQQTITPAVETGLPVKVSAKYWAEHFGLPYHQAAIREQEMAKTPYLEAASGVGAGSRSYTRYGYADYFRADRPFEVMFRIWPGTRRALLWGDPVTAAEYSRQFSFCGSRGVELYEPLSFKGRQGSGISKGRCGYSDASLTPRYDWEKFLVTYRLWGRLLYNPETNPEVWQRYNRKSFGKAAEASAAALAASGRILPLVTTAHGPSAANASYWPEIYTDMPIVRSDRHHPYGDTPSPKRFGKVSPFDPQLFASVDECVEALRAGEPLGKYTPAEVAGWLEKLAEEASANLARARKQCRQPQAPEFRRLEVDVALQCGLGSFFAGKLRAALLYGLYERSRDGRALSKAIEVYQKAKQACVQMAEGAGKAYLDDLTYGPAPHQRGHWKDRVAAMEQDIADMQQKLEEAGASQAGASSIDNAIKEILSVPARPVLKVQHTQPSRFKPGEGLQLTLAVEKKTPQQVVMHYRRVNQAERWKQLTMQGSKEGFSAEIPAGYTKTQFPLQYYFEIGGGNGGLALYPGLGPQLCVMPYFVVPRAA